MQAIEIRAREGWVAGVAPDHTIDVDRVCGVAPVAGGRYEHVLDVEIGVVGADRSEGGDEVRDGFPERGAIGGRAAGGCSEGARVGARKRSRVSGASRPPWRTWRTTTRAGPRGIA